MAKVMIFLVCQVLLGVLLVQGSALHSADDGTRAKRSAVKWWSPMASCLGIQNPTSASASKTLEFIRDNTLIVPLINVPTPASTPGALPHSGPCQFGRGLTPSNVNRQPNILSQAVCALPKCNPKLCQAVKYNVPILKKKPCRNANVWFRATEEVTVAYVEK